MIINSTEKVIHNPLALYLYDRTYLKPYLFFVIETDDKIAALSSCCTIWIGGLHIDPIVYIILSVDVQQLSFSWQRKRRIVGLDPEPGHIVVVDHDFPSVSLMHIP